METLFKNIELYCNILRKCSLPEVGKWQEEDVDRALHWANYFDKALVRITKRRSVTEEVDGKLREFGRLTEWSLGGKELNLESFRHSSQYLIRALLNNTCLPIKLKEMVKSKTKDQSSVVSPSLPSNPLSLLKNIHLIQMSGAPSSTHLFQLVCERLNVLLHTSGALDIILKSLKENLPTGSRFESTQKVILRWLMKSVKSSDSHLVWREPPDLLAAISSQYLDFFREHLKYLTVEMERLETVSPELTGGGPKARDELDTDKQKILKDVASTAVSNRSGSLDKIVTHFVALSRTNKDVREVCQLFVKSRALKHTTTRERFSFASPLTTCVWSRLLAAINKLTVSPK